MRAIPEALQARLDGGATTLCACWRIQRRDGAALGFTDHDAPVVLDGVVCAPGGFAASAIESATGLGVDNLRVEGALTSDAITEIDIAQGRYDGATVERWLVDWTAPELRVLTFRGRIGEIARGETAFAAEIEGVGAPLNDPIGRAYLPLCDAALGDRRCGVDLAGRGLRVAGEVAAVESARRLRAAGVGDRPAGWFAGGVLRWTTGACAGLAVEIVADAPEGAVRALELADDLRGQVVAGDRFTLDPGCDKRLATCRDRFANLPNFRGFPHVPGDGWVLSAPREGERHDGGSRRG